MLEKKNPNLIKKLNTPVLGAATALGIAIMQPD